MNRVKLSNRKLKFSGDRQLQKLKQKNYDLWLGDDMQQYTLIDAALVNGATVLLLGFFVRMWINNINKNITKLFDLHDKCTKEEGCTERRESIGRKIHAEADKVEAKADRNRKTLDELWKHQHTEKGQVFIP